MTRVAARFKQATQGLVRSAFGFELERFGRTVALIDPTDPRNAWFSQRVTLQALIAEFGITHVLDVGANTGQFAAQMRRVFPGPIHSFEPVASVFATLEARAAGDPLWSVHNVALGRTAGEQVIHVSEGTVFSSMLSTNEYCLERFGSDAHTVRNETVRVARLEDVLPAIIPDIAAPRLFLKMDTQGFDLEVFAGLGSMTSNVVALQTEASLIPLYDGMPHWTETVVTLEAAGFGVVGMYPVNIDDDGRVMEYDCLMRRSRAPS